MFSYPASVNVFYCTKENEKKSKKRIVYLTVNHITEQKRMRPEETEFSTLIC